MAPGPLSSRVADLCQEVGHRLGGATQAQVLDVLNGIAREYRLERYVPTFTVIEEDRAAVLSDTAFVQRTTNRMLSMRLADFLRIRNGKLVEFREFTDTFDAVEQAIGRWIEV